MSAVFSNASADARKLALIGHARPGRVFAWRDGRAVALETFLADVQAVAAALPGASAAVNLCEDRYAFLVAFCAIACRGQANLLPPSRARQAIEETLAAHPGSHAVGEARQAAIPRYLALPPLGIHGNTAQVPTLAAGQVIAIGFTSGSTGQPKANPHTWRAFRACTAGNVAALAALMRSAPDSIGSDSIGPDLIGPDSIGHVVATVPPQHMYGIELSILLPLLGPFAVHSGRPLFPADIAAALAQVPAPRVLATTPVHLRALLRDPTPLPQIAAIVSSTAPLPPELAAAAEARYGAPLLECFGSTETCIIAHRRCAIETDWHLSEGVRLHPQPDGTLVEAAYFEHAVALSDIVELHGGDRFRLCGRQSDLVDIAGKRASLADLTRRVLALRGVLDAAIVQADEPDSAGVRRLAALVVAPERSEADLLAELRAAIDPVFLPRPLRRIDALPRNATGKLPRAALLAALREAD